MGGKQLKLGTYFFALNSVLINNKMVPFPSFVDYLMFCKALPLSLSYLILKNTIMEIKDYRFQETESQAGLCAVLARDHKVAGKRPGVHARFSY